MQPQPVVHASINMPPKMHRALMERLFKERKSLSQWGREQAEAYLAVKK